MGQVFLAQGNLENARQAMQIAYQMAPQVPDIQKGMSVVEEAARKRMAPGSFRPPAGR
jgi:cytochrome c-type biogenesis protein CcmH/NrfG